MAVSASILSGVFTIAVIICRMISFIASPLYLDSLNPPDNITLPANATNTTFPFFLVVSQTTLPLCVWSAALAIVVIFFPHAITQRERAHPKKWLIFPGAAQALSSTLVNYSLSGTRTPTYLQALLANFNIPIQFITRYIILHKRPSCRKLLCALAVMVAEFLCLLPTIFPSLEPDSALADDGGATGLARILFPMLFIGSNIPYAIANVIMERSIQEKQSRDLGVQDDVIESREDVGDSDVESKPTGSSSTELNMVYYQFWYSLALCAGSWFFFWVDLIPGIGTSENIQEFGEKFLFNLDCVVGVECGPNVYLMAWGVILSNTAGYALVAYLLRYSEGANFFIVVMTLRSPLLFLFWTLFEENPFAWHPHVHLSTYLSIGALVVMVPAVILYNTGPPETTVTSEASRDQMAEQQEDRSPLLGQVTDESHAQERSIQR